jgi:probable phosphomutase (TIGR03848 family)
VTTVILIRHAHSVANEKGILAGRTSGIALSKKGLVQATDLKDRLGNLSFKEIRMSPLERCEATLLPWMQARKISPKSIVFDDDLSEVDYGKWTGKKLSVLALNKEWRVVQNTPSAMIFPEGESLANAQERAKRALMKSIKRAGNGTALLVSHGDVIKSIIATALELELDKFQKIVIDPASISVLNYSKNSFRILHLNDLSSNFEHLGKSIRNTKTLVGGGSGRS